MLKKQMDEMLSDLIMQERIAGAALRIRKDGEPVYEKCIGYANLQQKLPVTENTLFRIASMTKLIVAAGIMMLAERKELSLDDHLLKFFPDYPEEKKAVTVRHLLNHSSGFDQGEKSMAYYMQIWKPDLTLADYTERLGKIPFDCKPGEKADYSAVVNYDLLGRIIEIVTGQGLAEWLEQNLFLPLGMHDTTFFPTEEQYARKAVVYEQKDGILVEESGSNPLFQTINLSRYPAGSGGLYSTLHDYDRFTSMLCMGGSLDGVRILQEETITLMRTPRQITQAEWQPGLPWGLGFRIFEHPEKSGIAAAPGTFGWSGALGTHMFVHQEKGICATFMVAQADLGGGMSFISRNIEKITFENL